MTHGGDLFATAREHRWDWREVIDFSASINPLGPSPSVREAIVQSLDRIIHYPEREPVLLRKQLGLLWGIDHDQILLGNGGTELIYFFARTVAPGKVTIAVPAFSEFLRAFPHAAQLPLEDTTDWPDDQLLILTRPANPTGRTLPFAPLARWLEQTTGPVLIDESFLDFTSERSIAALLSRRDELFILRSLTKFYALPGLRVGALLASPQAVLQWRAVREPWQVNVLAEAAALAAVSDSGHSRKTLAFVSAEREWLSGSLTSIVGVHPQPGDANFLFASLDYSARRLADFLLQRKLLIRVCTGWPGVHGEAVRIAVRTRAENEILLREWRLFPCD